MEIQKGLRNIILIELLVPLGLLLFGTYHGVLQVLYRAGTIHADCWRASRFSSGG